MSIPRSTKRQRLNRAGYVQVSGWLPRKYGETVRTQIEMHREDVERIAKTEGKPGRPFIAKEKR